MPKFALLLFFLSLLFPIGINAESNRFVNIVNPVRISSYTSNPTESLNTQHAIVKSFELPATWLITYDVLKKEDMVTLLKSFQADHEIGIFMEISKQFASDSSVSYSDSFSWHHAKNIFLTGYKQEERIKLIDLVFKQFKDSFGYYPKSVGAWWIDSYSLKYMKEKYDITASLGLADQYSTDGYRVWGTPWGVPFYPSEFHSGIPSLAHKIDVVMLQWAPRDPLNGYSHSYYSTQDYLQEPVGQATSYFERLLEFYALNSNRSFGQIVVGLEGDLDPGSYHGEFKNQLEVIKKIKNDKQVEVHTMKTFSEWYKTKNFYKDNHIMLEPDILGTKNQSIWFQNTNYRVGMIYNDELKKTEIIDIRVYNDNFQEPYYYSPNYGTDLFINIPSLIDSQSDQKEIMTLETGLLVKIEKGDGGHTLFFENGTINLKTDRIILDLENSSFPNNMLSSSLINKNPNNNQLFLNDRFVTNPEGYSFKSLSEPARRTLLRKRTILLGLVAVVGASLMFFFLFKSNIQKQVKIIITTFAILNFATVTYVWFNNNLQTYFASQSEIEALIKLSTKENGKVLVYDKMCLGCEWNSEYKPAAFENKRSYVEKWSRMNIVKNQKVFDSVSREVARDEFNKTGAKYIYVTKYGKYIEKVPFSPGDLGIQKVYDNANAEIWQKVK